MGRTAEVTAINPPGLRIPPTISAAVAVDGMVFLSGVVPVDLQGALVGAGDPTAQAHSCLDQIEQVLVEAGGSLEDIVRVTCFATSAEAARAYIAVRAARLKARPAATAVVIPELLIPGALMEVEAIAYVPGRGNRA